MPEDGDPFRVGREDSNEASIFIYASCEDKPYNTSGYHWVFSLLQK